jgi:hypothetical protein
MKKAELFTIKVLKSTINALNIVAAMSNESQYEAADRIAKNELAKVTSESFKKSKK